MKTLSDIYRYPVKSLCPEHLDSVDLHPDEGLSGDRLYALAPASAPIDGTTSPWIEKTHFVVLVKHEKLAALETEFDNQTQTLTIRRGGRQVARGNLGQSIGRTMIEEFFTAYMGEKVNGRIRVIKAADGHSLEDQSKRSVSIINLATVRDIERVAGRALDPMRFRGNFYIDTEEPWQEFNWIDQQISIGGATLKITARTGRCAATHVNPETAERDINLLKFLQQGFSHTDCGVFAEVITGGKVAVGDQIKFP
jgi:uncharacterized protein